MIFRYFTAGESHGQSLNAIIEGVPAGIQIDIDFINNELKKRQIGYGRGGRMQIESDTIIIKSGVRFGISTGSPICIEIINKDFENWKIPMSTTEIDLTDENIKNAIIAKKITHPRPGHADLAGMIKYNFDDIRNVLERSSARETAIRVAVGAIAKLILKNFEIEGVSHVIQIGTVKANYNNFTFEEIKEKVVQNDLRCCDYDSYEKMKEIIDTAKEEGDSLGGKIQIIYKNLPIGLGAFVQYDRKIDGKLAGALMSVQAIKAVEFGLGEKCAEMKGSEVHDEIFYNDGYWKKTNNAGGIEGGMTNGENLVITCSMKPIPTIKKALHSVDMNTKEDYSAHYERTDTCAVSACGVVLENVCATVLVDEFLRKFGGDSLDEIKHNYNNYIKMVTNK